MKYQLENYRKFLLNRVTASKSIIDYIENVAGSEDESAKHTFHKVMVHNWSGADNDLFDTLSEYYNTTIIPVNYTSHQNIQTFYTCSLSFILRVIKLDFIFPYEKSMFNLDIIFNDKTSADCFENRITIDDIVAGIVSNRLNDKCELDLSNFSEDSELLQKNIFFHKLSLLSHFKILMLRMGRDTKSLNLSYNKLSTIPHDILNFFIKGDLLEVNLSHNDLKSLSLLQRMTSKVEKLWLEGNPLCDDIEPSHYIKQVHVKFPRLKELDGVKLNTGGILLPSYKNFIETPDRRTKMATEKFLTLYFTNFDSKSRNSINKFYSNTSQFTFTTTCEEFFIRAFPHLAADVTNLIARRFGVTNKKQRQQHILHGQSNITAFLGQLPATVHDPSSFTVDVLKHDGKSLVIIVNGLCELKNHLIPSMHFRRTFWFHTKSLGNSNVIYQIEHELFTLTIPTEVQKELLKVTVPKRNLSTLCLLDPSSGEINSICETFMQLTQLKRAPSELRLKLNEWDIKAALAQFLLDLKADRISHDNFEDDDFSDMSSISDEID